jgi:hypothetical protein
MTATNADEFHGIDTEAWQATIAGDVLTYHQRYDILLLAEYAEVMCDRMFATMADDEDLTEDDFLGLLGLGGIGEGLAKLLRPVTPDDLDT